MNITKFRFAIRRCSVDAPAYTKQIFTSSDGWNDTPPSWIQLRAPNFSVPSTRFTARSSRPAAEARYRNTFARSRSRSVHPTKRNTTRPAQSARNSFSRLSGALAATTAKPIVVRKNAMVSTSKPRRRISFSPKNSAHSTSIRPRNASSTSGRRPQPITARNVTSS